MDTPPGIGGLDSDEPDAEELRAAMTSWLREQGSIRGASVASAFRYTPRHLFLPGVALYQAYADSVVPTKYDARGQSISAASQPTIVALMLEQLDARRGQKVLEIGAGTGYNAALLGRLVGRSGKVFTVDVDQDLVEAAVAHLVAAEAANVEVVLGDGALGHPSHAPYDRITVTVGAGDIPPAWVEQLGPRGRLVVPLRLRGDVTFSLALDLASDGRMYSSSAEACTFMPLRGIADDAGHVLDLTADSSVSVHLHHEHEGARETDPEALGHALDQPSGEISTGVLLDYGDSFSPLDLYLTCALPGGLCKLTTSPGAEAGLFGGGMAAVAERSLACLTVFPGSGADGGRAENGWEVGVAGFGPEGGKLAETVAGFIQDWDREVRGAPARFTLAQGDARAGLTGRFVIEKRFSRIAVDWS